jgi:hypothetical protein
MEFTLHFTITLCMTCGLATLPKYRTFFYRFRVSLNGIFVIALETGIYV